VVVGGGNWAQCSPWYSRLEEIIRSGFVARNDCDSKATSNQKYVAKPGELIVFTHDISFIEKLKSFPG
jgi:hypothetical protein